MRYSGQERKGRRTAFRREQIWSYFGPAFVASVAYIDPGNFTTNIQAGAQFGYRMLWVLLWSNAMAILIQYLSAKRTSEERHPQENSSSCMRVGPSAANCPGISCRCGLEA